MSLDPNKDHSIDLETASKLTKRYREKIQSGATISSAFNKMSISAIMDQPECVGLRMYYAVADNGKDTLVLVGVNEEGDDLYEGKLMEWGGECPPNRASMNPLKSSS